MIKRIFIDNYKCFVNFELRLEELTFLVGGNGVGKTSVLDVLHAVRRLLDGTGRIMDRDVFPTSSLTRWQTRDEQVVEIDVELGTDKFVYRIVIEHDRSERRARIASESLTGNGRPLFEFKQGEVHRYRDDHSEGPKFPSDGRESSLARVPARNDNSRLTRFLEFVRGVLVCSPNPPNFAREASSEDALLSRDGANFVAWYRHLAQERQHLIPNHTRAMQAVLNGLRGFRLEKVGVDTRTLVGVFGGEKGSPELGFGEMSDGQRALTVLYALTTLTAHHEHLLAIDDPVNYVAPREIQPWLMGLDDACGDAFPQVVICSHHPEVIDYLGAESGVLLRRDGLEPARAEPLTASLEVGAFAEPLKLSEIIARGWEG